MNIVELDDKNRGPVDRYIRDEWAGPMVATLGNLYDTSTLPGYIALEEGQLAGAIVYRIENGVCEISTLFSLIENHGAGTALINKVIATARNKSCNRIWLVTTNDNTHAIRFYQKYGFDLKAVHINGIERTRRLKPGLPARGIDGISLAHEFEFEIMLGT